MRKSLAFGVLALALAFVLIRANGFNKDANRNGKPAYPPARTIDRTDVYHGVSVKDPYRWMEDLDSQETRAWVKLQDDFGSGHLRALPEYARFRSRILALNEYESVSPALLAGGKLFFTRVPRGARARAVIEVAEGEDSPARTLLDTNEFPPEETLRLVLPSDDGKFIAFGVRRNASNWFELRFLDVEAGKILPDVLRGLNSSASPAWSRDGKGVYYGVFAIPEPGKERTQKLENQSVRYHRLGAPQEDDEPVFAAPEHPDWRFAASETEDGQYLVLTATVGTTSQSGIYVRELRRPAPPWRQIIPVGEEAFTFRGNNGPVLWLQTDADAPRGRVIAVDIRNPARSNWKDVIPQSADTLNFVNLVDHRFVAVYVQEAKHIIKVFSQAGKFERDVKFPDWGTTFSGFIGRPGDRMSYYSFNSVSYPPGASVFRLDARTGESVPFRQPRLSYRPSDYETRQVFYKSKDGTRVPMFIAAKRGLKLDGSSPAFLYAYGAGGWQAMPWFQPHVLAWMEAGGIYALANVRGGGEYGEQWHQAGIKKNKQNTIDDYIAAAEWLIANGYTTKERLTINGGSLSSPLAGAALVQRPELFGAVLMDISVTDMVRYDHFTGGAGWRAELGSSSDPEEFRALLAYSPYHNLKPGTCYPPVLITAGERDETTVPSHSYKFTAALQAAQQCSNPVLLQVMWGAGHTLGNTREQSAEILGRQLAFLFESVKVTRKENPRSD